MRNFIIYLLRHGAGDQKAKDRFPPVKSTWVIKTLDAVLFGKIYSRLIYKLSKKRRGQWTNFLINAFHIPWALVPADAIENKFRETLEYLIADQGKDNLGDYLEFGVYQGTSLLSMYRVINTLKLDAMNIYGFDSFEGLPPLNEIDSKVWCEGQFKADLKFTRERLTQGGVDWSRVELTKGFFHDTLNDELKEQFQMKKASVIMVDCDMYVGAQQVLEFCAPLIKDKSAVIFDDWHSTDDEGGEKRAFREFLAKYPDFQIKEELQTYDENARVVILERKN